VALATLRTTVLQLQARLALRTARPTPTLERIRRDPTAVMTLAGQKPDPWQRELLTTGTTSRRVSAERTLLLCSRQSGKSTVSAALALQAALLEAKALVLLLSPSLRQSAELYRKCADLYKTLGKPIDSTAESALRVEFANGSRIISLPGRDDAAIRGFSSPRLVVIDEVARVPDALYLSCRPMLAVSQGRLLALSTPFGKRGWFFEAWHSQENWRRVKITADQCPRIGADFLTEERQALGDRWFEQEYRCEFVDMVGAVFRSEDIDAAFNDDCKPLFGG
jgi:hypothetical protein